MGENNKSYRIRTVVGQDGNLTVNLDQNYDIFEVLSIKIKQEDTYKLHSSNYGVIVGRVLANEGFGVPNAKISVFIQGEYDASSNTDIAAVYPYQTTMSQGKDGVVYNLLPDNQVDDCHQVVGTFPNKTYLLDNDILIEVFDTYYKYTTRTNNSGDYIICGVPTGQQTIHMDLDLSDCGILSQRPRDFVYKGYTIEQFENPNQFKTGKELSSLSQIFRQDAVVNVIPFWGNEELGETIGITRADINVNFKFEPTCVFMGCLVGDNSSNGVSKKCIATNQMGAMDELVTGEGTIEMIRKTANGDVEEFQIKGTQLIDGNGVWCYQIPMNLDYMMTDEYGNMVPTDDPTKGIPTRARVRFRISMQDNEQNYNNYFRAKVLVPHNPQSYFSGDTLMHEDYDYEFGTYTKEESFRDLFWNNVYTVKSYIPRFQKSKTSKSERFTGIKHCNIYGQNNPMPYNNIRIKLPLMFTLLCVLIKTYVWITGVINSIISGLGNAFADMGNFGFTIDIPPFKVLGIEKGKWWHYDFRPFKKLYGQAVSFKMNVLSEGLCPDLENWYFAPIRPNNLWKIGESQVTPDGYPPYDLLEQTFYYLQGKQRKADKSSGFDKVDTTIDENSIDESNTPDSDSESVCLTINTDYLMSCIEMNLAQMYKVINFDFYNDWVNGAIYMPRWMKFVRKKRTFLFGLIKIKPKVKACMDDSKLFGKTRYYTQQCSLTYSKVNKKYTKIDNHNGCMSKPTSKKQNCHKNKGLNRYSIFGSGKKNVGGNGGVVHEKETMLSQFVYYFKPCEWRTTNGKKTILFANDLVLLGSLNDCNLHGIPQAFKYLTSSSYIMPTNLALTNMDDDGYLYADGSGTMCSGKENSKNLNENDSSAHIEQLGTTFSATSKYYSTSQNENVSYGNSEEPEVLNYDDTIPLTEAAGISWNYTGPGQGTPSNNVTKSLYYPGGHFLGLSCVNSMTNIKSCINLQRICEAGSTMSQRREEVRSISYRPDDGNSEIYYKYFVPTGLISQDDINGTDFRSMFATMNKNRLLCTGNIDEKTGYPIYDFVYMRPNGFDGALKDRVSKDGRFNMNLDTLDESAWMKKQGVSQSDDYDAEETRQTATRTIEDASEDYYMFRLGLKGLSDEEQKDRFLRDDGSRVALPQYENSFYFYFGLKDGSTALDEFNKQFFSTCSSKSLFMTAPSIIGNTEFSKCNLTFKLNLKIENMTSPATLTLKNRERNQTYVVGADVTGKTTMYFTYPRNGHPEDEDLVMGTYDVEVVDNEGQTAMETINIGLNSVRINTESKNFEFRTKTITDPRDVINTASDLSCGYIEFDDEISVWNSETNQYDTENISSSNWDLLIVDTEGNYAVTDNIPLGSLNIICIGNNYSSLSFDANTNRFYVWKADEEYDLYLIHKCEDDNRYYNAYYSTYRVNGIDNYDLYLGNKYLPYSTKLKSKSGTWWNNIGSDTSGFENWAMRHALFRQTDNDSEAFTNNVISLDNNGNVIDTALFGQPEIYNTDSGKYKPEGNKIYYEGDTSFFSGDLSDDSIVPTWGYLAGNEEVDGKRLPFEEMAMYNGVVSSDKIGDYNATFSESGNRIKITASLPSSVIDGNGCIVKLEDGTFVYPVREGTSLYYYGELPEDTSQKISIYPVFVFPVMYKPFYGQMRIVDWAGSRLIMTDMGLEEAPSVSDDLETFLTRLDVYNGITYNGEFEDSDASSIFNRRLSNNAITKIGDNGDLDGGENRHTLRTYTCSGRTESLDMYSFSVKEGSPIMSEEEYAEINTPYKLELASIEGNMSNDLPTYINYKYDEFNDIIFVSDNDGSAADFYLVKASPTNPLKEQGAIGLKINSGKGYVLGKFNQIANSTCSKNKVGEDVVVEINGLIATVQMYLSSDAETIEPRNVIIWNGIDFILSDVTKGSNTYAALSNIGVDLQFNYVQDTLNYNNLSTYTDITPSNSVIKINLGKSNNVSIQSGNYIIGVASEPSGEKGFIKVARIYSNIMQIQKYNPPTEIGLQIEPEGESGIYPSATENTGTTFISTGGELQIRIKATGSWKFVLDGDSSFKIKEGSNLVNSTTGTGNTYLTIKASENTSSDDKAATGTATSLADESVTSYTSFLLKGRAETNYIEAETITTFGDGGGQLGIKVISNKSDGWTLNLTNLSSDNWIKFSNNSNTITGNGNSTVYVIANANGTQNERNARVRIDDCVGGNYELSFTQEQNQGGVSLIVSPLSLHFNKEGSTQYITVTCNSTWETSIDASWATIYDLSDRIKVVCDPNNGEQRSCNITILSNGVSKVVNVIQDDGVEKYIRTRFNVNSTTFEEKNDIEITIESNTSWRLTKEGNPDWFKISGGTQTYDGIGDEVVNCSVTKNLGEARTCVIQTRATLNDCIPVPETTSFFQNSSEYMFLVTNNSNIVIQRISLTTNDETLIYDESVGSWETKPFRIFNNEYNVTQTSIVINGDISNIDYISFNGLQLTKTEYGNFVGGGFTLRNFDIYTLEVHYN